MAGGCSPCLSVPGPQEFCLLEGFCCLECFCCLSIPAARVLHVQYQIDVTAAHGIRDLVALSTDCKVLTLTLCF